MIDSVSLTNVRQFSEEPTTFRFSPLTVFCGSNGSGKTTVLSSILLLRQTMGEFREQARSYAGECRFVGPQIDLGGYQQFVHKGDLSRHAEIEIGFSYEMDRQRLESLLTRRTGPTEDPTNRRLEELLSRRPGEAKVVLLRNRASFTLSGGHPSLSSDSEVVPGAVSRAQGRLEKAEFTWAPAGREESISWSVEASQRAKREEAPYRLRLPRRWFSTKRIVGGAMRKQLENELRQSRKDKEFISLPIDLEGLLPGVAMTKDRRFVFPVSLWNLLRLMSARLQGELRRIHYLGPFRNPAERYYLTEAGSLSTLDPRGEFLPYVLRGRGSQQVAYTVSASGEPRTATLTEALSYWLYYLRTGDRRDEELEDQIVIRADHPVLVEVDLVGGSGVGSYPLADSGFGYSQVLPILVRGLVAHPNCIIVVEQPELHLNPALQVRLADFLVTLVRLGKQVIVETHSEYIVHAVRAIAAEDESGWLAQNVGVNYLQMQNGSPSVMSLDIGADGTMPGIPEEFFGEATHLGGRLLRAQRRFLRSRQVREGDK